MSLYWLSSCRMYYSCKLKTGLAWLPANMLFFFSEGGLSLVARIMRFWLSIISFCLASYRSWASVVESSF